MSIAIISRIGFVGGISAASVRVRHYADALQMMGESVFILSYEDFCHGSELIEISSGIMAFGGQRRNNTSMKEFFSTLSTLVAYNAISGVIFYPVANPYFECLFLRWSRCNPLIRTICEINEVRKYDQAYSKAFSFPKRLVYKMVSSLSEHLTGRYSGLICISEHIRRYFFKYNSRSIVIPILSDVDGDVPIRITRHNNMFRFVFTGTVSIEKENLAELIKGFYLLDNIYTKWEFLLYGVTPPEDKMELERLLLQLGLNQKVKLMGTVEHNMIRRILSSADCLILPRRNTEQNYYGFSTKLSEYAVSGTPILLTDTGVVLNYFKDGRDCYLVDGYEAEGFSKQLFRIVSATQQERDRIGLNAYETAKKFFDWHNYSKLLKDFIIQ